MGSSSVSSSPVRGSAGANEAGAAGAEAPESTEFLEKGGNKSIVPLIGDSKFGVNAHHFECSGKQVCLGKTLLPDATIPSTLTPDITPGNVYLHQAVSLFNAAQKVGENNRLLQDGAPPPDVEIVQFVSPRAFNNPAAQSKDKPMSVQLQTLVNSTIGGDFGEYKLDSFELIEQRKGTDGTPRRRFEVKYTHTHNGEVQPKTIYLTEIAPDFTGGLMRQGSIESVAKLMEGKPRDCMLSLRGKGRIAIMQSVLQIQDQLKEHRRLGNASAPEFEVLLNNAISEIQKHRPEYLSRQTPTMVAQREQIVEYLKRYYNELPSDSASEESQADAAGNAANGTPEGGTASSGDRTPPALPPRPGAEAAPTIVPKPTVPTAAEAAPTIVPKPTVPTAASQAGKTAAEAANTPVVAEAATTHVPTADVPHFPTVDTPDGATAAEAAVPTAAEATGTTDPEASRTTDLEASRTTDLEASRTTDLEAAGTTPVPSSLKITFSSVVSSPTSSTSNLINAFINNQMAEQMAAQPAKNTVDFQIYEAIKQSNASRRALQNNSDLLQSDVLPSNSPDSGADEVLTAEAPQRRDRNSGSEEDLANSNVSSSDAISRSSDGDEDSDEEGDALPIARQDSRQRSSSSEDSSSYFSDSDSYVKLNKRDKTSTSGSLGSSDDDEVSEVGSRRDAGDLDDLSDIKEHELYGSASVDEKEPNVAAAIPPAEEVQQASFEAPPSRPVSPRKAADEGNTTSTVATQIPPRDKTESVVSNREFSRSNAMMKAIIYGAQGSDAITYIKNEHVHSTGLIKFYERLKEVLDSPYRAEVRSLISATPEDLDRLIVEQNKFVALTDKFLQPGDAVKWPLPAETSLCFVKDNDSDKLILGKQSSMPEKDRLNAEEILVLGSGKLGFRELDIDEIEQKCRLDPAFFTAEGTRSGPFTLNIGFKYQPGNQQMGAKGFSADRTLTLKCDSPTAPNQQVDLKAIYIAVQKPGVPGYITYTNEKDKWWNNISSRKEVTSAQIDDVLSRTELRYVAYKSIPVQEAEQVEEVTTTRPDSNQPNSVS